MTDDKNDKGEVSQIYLISPAGGEAIQLTQRSGRSAHIFLVSRFAHHLLRDAQSLDKGSERRLQKGMERCGAISHR